MSRTSLILDPDTRRAARELAMRYDCSVSEAIRRAVLRQRDAVLGQRTGQRSERRRLLDRLFTLFDDNDPKEEIDRLKQEDEGF